MVFCFKAREGFTHCRPMIEIWFSNCQVISQVLRISKVSLLIKLIHSLQRQKVDTVFIMSQYYRIVMLVFHDTRFCQKSDRSLQREEQKNLSKIASSQD